MKKEELLSLVKNEFTNDILAKEMQIRLSSNDSSKENIKQIAKILKKMILNSLAINEVDFILNSLKLKEEGNKND